MMLAGNEPSSRMLPEMARDQMARMAKRTKRNTTPRSVRQTMTGGGVIADVDVIPRPK